MDTKNIEQLIDTTLNLLYDLNGHKSKDKVIELLQSEVFSKIDKENFVVIFDDIRRINFDIFKYFSLIFYFC